MKCTLLFPHGARLLISLVAGVTAVNAQAQADGPCFNAPPPRPDVAISSPEISDLTAGPDTSDVAERPVSTGTQELKRIQVRTQQVAPPLLTGEFNRDFIQEMTRQLEQAVDIATVGASRGETPELRALAQKIVNAQLEMKAELRRLRERELRQR